MIFSLLISLLLHAGAPSAQAAETRTNPAIRTFPGYVSKISCEGKLLVSSVGNDSIIRAEPLPASIGCAVLIKPLVTAGRTNLILETSSSSVHATIEIRSGTPTHSDLHLKLQGDHQ